MTGQQVLYLIVSFIVIEFVFEKVLSWLNLQTWKHPLPSGVNDLYEEKKYHEAQAYAKVNYRFSLFSSVFSLLISLLFLTMGGFSWVDGWVQGVTENYIMQSLLFFAVLSLASGIIGLPFELYNTFVIEEKFGFNKTTISIFIADKLKAVALGTVIGGGLLALLAFLFHLIGAYFWLAAWAVVAAFSIFMAMFYTSWLLPLFNKLTPLQDGELRQSIEQYASKVQFPLTNVFVMDGSKRSAKANAFFSGLGSKKNIVLYDTLISDMTTEEITAVLAHEVGHYKRKHILQSMVLSVLQMGFMFFLFGLLSNSQTLAQALGASQINFHLALVAFSLLYSPVSTVIGIWFNAFSRKNEYEADAYARDTYAAEPLITALKKMSVKHLSNLQPHKWYVAVNYSHPTLLQRMNALTAIQ